MKHHGKKNKRLRTIKIFEINMVKYYMMLTVITHMTVISVIYGFVKLCYNYDFISYDVY